MNLWNDSGLRWAPETESKPEIERNHLHHRDMSNSVKYNTTSQWCQHTRLLRTMCPIWIIKMNLWNDSGQKWAPETESKPEIERNHLHHRDMSKSVKYNTTSQWSQHTRPLNAKCPIWIKWMNLWNDSGLKWAPETESKPEIERNHLHHRDMSKSVKYNTTSQWSQHTRPLNAKCPIWIKWMNLWNDSGLKWAPETESKPEIERKHLHHRVMSNSVNYNTTSQWSQHTRLLSTKCPIWKNK